MAAKKKQKPLKQVLRREIIITVLLTLVFAFYLLRVPVSAGVTLLSFLCFIVAVFPYIALGNPVVPKKLERMIKPSFYWTAAGSIWAVAAVYALFSGQAGLWNLAFLAVYIALPFVIHLSSKGSEHALRITDVLLLFLLWLPVEFDFVPALSLPPAQGFVSLTMIVALLIALLIFYVDRRLGVGYDFRLKNRDWTFALFYFMLFFVIAVVIGGRTGFIEMTDRIPSARDVLIHLFGIAFFIALPEEILFRGIIYTLIASRLKNRRYNVLWALIISSVIFGLAHGNNPQGPFLDINLGSLGIWQMPWVYVLLATIAGFFYGWVFIRTRKVTAAALMHLMVDWAWFVFFD